MKANKYLLAIFIVQFFIANLSFGQFGFKQKDILEFQSFQSFDKIQSEGEVKLAFKITIFDEWHINSNKPKEDFLIPTEIKITSTSSIQQSEY